MLKLGPRNLDDDNGYGGLVSVIDQVLEGLAWDDRAYEGQEVKSWREQVGCEMLG